MGPAWGRGVKEGPGPQEEGKISSQCSERAEATMRRKRRNRQVGHDEEGSARTE
jgi:hypothetical protein